MESKHPLRKNSSIAVAKTSPARTKILEMLYSEKLYSTWLNVWTNQNGRAFITLGCAGGEKMNKGCIALIGSVQKGLAYPHT